MSRSKMSPARALVMLVWDNCKAQSWIRLNHTMQAALSLAISSGMKFDEADIETIYQATRGHFWFGSRAETQFFSLAVESGNVSACRAWEDFAGRTPYILGGKRLYIGAQVDGSLLEKLQREPVFGIRPPQGVFVTSFGGEDTGVNLCVYEETWPKEGGGLGPNGNPIRRIRLTHQDVRALEKARKGSK